MNKHRINQAITCPEIRLVLEDKSAKIMKTNEAIKIAEEQDKDLVEIVPEATPPVCKIIEYEKYVYQIKKEEKELKKKQKFTTLKEVQFGLNMGQADYKTKLYKVDDFITTGYKVSCSIFLKKRQSSLWSKGATILNNVASDLGDKVMIEKPPTEEKKKIFMVIIPNNKKKSKK